MPIQIAPSRSSYRVEASSDGSPSLRVIAVTLPPSRRFTPPPAVATHVVPLRAWITERTLSPESPSGLPKTTKARWLRRFRPPCHVPAQRLPSWSTCTDQIWSPDKPPVVEIDEKRPPLMRLTPEPQVPIHSVPALSRARYVSWSVGKPSATV